MKTQLLSLILPVLLGKKQKAAEAQRVTCRYPLAPSKHLNLVWMALKVLSTISCVATWAMLYWSSAALRGSSTGVISHFLSG